MTELMRLYSTELRVSSDTLLSLGRIDFRWKNLFLSGSNYGAVLTSSTTVSCSSVNCVNIETTNVKATSSVILYMAGSSIKLNNGTNSCINTPILVAPPPVMADGNFWFFSSSNQMYLAVRSNSATYFVIMAT